MDEYFDHQTDWKHHISCVSGGYIFVIPHLPQGLYQHFPTVASILNDLHCHPKDLHDSRLHKGGGVSRYYPPARISPPLELTRVPYRTTNCGL